jgi:chemotaxis protein methyltransferase CheR
VKDEAGIVLPDNKANLMYSRLSKRVRECGLETFGEYCALVEESAGERQALIAAMTTNVTRFFRESHHFDHLRDSVLPDLIEAARKGARVRIWSSACSSGEEPYSVALTLLAAMPDAANTDILILASDVDPNMVATAKAGRYPIERLADIPKALHGRYIERDGSHFRLADSVRGLLRFRQLNLLKDWPMRGGFDVIFCRNVMIYFDQDTQDAIWSRFARLLPQNGHLYIGHSERIASSQFLLTAQTAYRRAA